MSVYIANKIACCHNGFIVYKLCDYHGGVK